MVKTREDFALEIGGFLDGVSGEITDAIFDVASGKYADQVMTGGGNAKPPIVLTLTVESPDLEKPAIQSFSVGSQDIWEIVDGGKAIQHIKDADKHSFRKGSMAGHLVESMMTALGDGDLEKGQAEIIKRDHYMTEAAFYTGLSFLWATKDITFQIGDKTVVSHPPMPDKFMGMTKTGKAAPGTGGTKAGGSVSNDTLDKILVDNASGKDEKALKSFAVRNPEIKKDDAYMKAVVSGKKLRELENAGTLTMDPTTKTYL